MCWCVCGGVGVVCFPVHVTYWLPKYQLRIGFRVEVKFGSKCSGWGLVGMVKVWRSGAFDRIMSMKVLRKSEVQESVCGVVCQACWPRPPLLLIHLLCTEGTETGCWKGGSEAPTDSPFRQLLFSLAHIVTSPGPPGPHMCALLSPRSGSVSGEIRSTVLPELLTPALPSERERLTKRTRSAETHISCLSFILSIWVHAQVVPLWAIIHNEK